MRILIPTAWFTSELDPIRNIFVERDVKLISQSHEVKVAHLGLPEIYGNSILETTYNDLPVTLIPMATTNPIQIKRAGAKLIEMAKEFDLVHTMAFHTLLPFSKLFGGSRPGVPWIHTEHSSAIAHPETLSPINNIYYKIVRRELRNPDHVIAVSEQLQRKIIDIRKDENVSIIPNLLDEVSNLKRLSIRKENLNLIFIGGFIDRKNPLLAIKTIAKLHELGIKAKMKMIGEGPLESTAKEMTKYLKLNEYIDFLGLKSHQEVLEEISNSDIFFVPTKGETFFLACAESLSLGRPVVVGASGAHSEYVKSPYGTLVIEENEEAYANAILKVVSDSKSFSAKEVAKSIEKEFFGSNITLKLEEVYMRVAQSRSQ